MKLIVVGFLILLLALSGLALAFQNEPEGFRGLKWGIPLGEDMEFLIKQDEFMNYYTLPEDKLELGDVQLLAIQYQFFNQRFSGVFVFFKGETNHSKMKTICEGRFGEPTNTGFETIAWEGVKASVLLNYDSVEKDGALIIGSVPLLGEYLQAKKKLETEKAEGEW